MQNDLKQNQRQQSFLVIDGMMLEIIFNLQNIRDMQLTLRNKEKLTKLTDKKKQVSLMCRNLEKMKLRLRN